MRRTGNISGVAGLRTGDHACWGYSSDAEHREVLTDYLVAGIAAGDKLAVFLSAGQEHLASDYLGAAGFDADELVDEHRLVIGSAQEAYTPAGLFEPEARLIQFEAMAGQSREEGFAGLRVFGEIGWLLAKKERADLLAEYEVRADLLVARAPIAGLCGYDLRECDENELALLRAVHPLTVGNPSDLTFHLHARMEGGIALHGEIDMRGEESLRSVLMAASGDLLEPVIDLSDVAFIDGSGIQSVADAASRLSELHGHASIVGSSDVFRKAWDALGHSRLTRVEVAA